MKIEIKQEIVKIGECPINTLKVEGSGETPHLILLHGAKFKAQTWKEIGTLDFFGKEGFSATAIDMPGFGQSPYCTADPVAILADFLKTKEIRDPVILGPSMGGRTTLNFYFAHPHLVKALVLVGTVGVEENARRLSSIEVPCLIVWGEKDDIAPLSHAHLLHERIPTSKLFIMSDAPHPCYLKDPILFNKEVLRFIQEVFNEGQG